MKFGKCFKLLVCMLLMLTLIPLEILQVQASDVDKSKIIWLDEKYERFESLGDGLIKAGIGGGFSGKWGMIDKTGKEIIAPTYESLHKHKGDLITAEIEEDDQSKYGFIDRSGKVVIPFQYADAGFFSEDLVNVAIKENGQKKWGFIDKNGNTVIPFKYSDASYFKNGIANVALDDDKDKKWYYIDKNDQIKMSVNYRSAGNFNEDGLARIGKKPDAATAMLYGFIDKSGKEVVAPKYNFMISSGNGLYLVNSGKYNDMKYGFIDKTGKEVIPMKYVDADTFVNGWAAVAEKIDGKRKYFYIDTKGNTVLEVDYYTANSFYKKGFAKVSVKNGETRKYGFIDKSGKEIVKCQFDQIGPITDDIAFVKFEGKWGIIALSDLFGANVAKEDSKTPSKPNTPSTAPTAPAKGEIKAKYSVVKLSIDSVKAEGMEIYNIEDSNYFKLRDVAKLLDSTQKKFSVSWNNEKKMISLKTKESYQALGTELSGGDQKDKMALLSDAKLELNGQAKSLKAYTINGNNYFKLRDLAEILDVKVDWDAATSTILLKTK